MGPKICTGPQGLLCSMIKWSTKPEMLFYSSSITICSQTIDQSMVYKNKYIFLLSFANSDRCFFISCHTTDHGGMGFCHGQVPWKEAGCLMAFSALALQLLVSFESVSSFLPLWIPFAFSLMRTRLSQWIPPLTTSNQTIPLNEILHIPWGKWQLDLDGKCLYALVSIFSPLYTHTHLDVYINIYTPRGNMNLSFSCKTATIKGSMRYEHAPNLLCNLLLLWFSL